MRFCFHQYRLNTCLEAAKSIGPVKVVSVFVFLSIEVVKMRKRDFVPDARYTDIKTSTKVFEQKQLNDQEENKLENQFV